MITKQRKKKTARDIRHHAKVALLHRRMTVTDLAKKLQRPRNTVSMAINRRVFPKIQALIASELNIA